MNLQHRRRGEHDRARSRVGQRTTALLGTAEAGWLIRRATPYLFLLGCLAFAGAGFYQMVKDGLFE